MSSDIIKSDRLLRLSQILERIPVSKSAWWAGVRSGRYPKPRKLSPRVTVWRESDINAIIDFKKDELH
jgi:predicted DNA-binding transcriptional regulator AlpA